MQLLQKIGGIEKAIRYLEKNGNFLEIAYFKKATALQLQEYIVQLTKFGLEPKRIILLFDNNPNISDVLSQYENLKVQCSVRTINVLHNLENSYNYHIGLTNKILYLNTLFFQQFDFLTIRNSGARTAMELYDLGYDLREFNKQLESAQPSDNSASNNQESEINSCVEQEKVGLHTIQEYEIIKLKSSVRTVNILVEIERQANYNLSYKNKIIFIEKYFLDPFDYYNFKNAGTKTVGELLNIRKSLDPKKLRFKNIETGIIASPITTFLKTHLQETNLDGLKISEKFSLQRVFCVVISQTKMTLKVKKIMEGYFLTKRNLSINEIAEKAECSIETVRTSVKRITLELFPSILELIKPFKEELELENATYYRQNVFLEVRQLDDFGFNDKLYAPNSKLSYFLLQQFLSESFTFINEVPLLEENKSRVFDCKDSMFFIANSFATANHFSDFLQFLDNEIYAFESVFFEYNLEVLIRRFYHENHLATDKASLDALCDIIRKIKREVIEIDSSKIGKFRRSQNKDNIKNIIEEFLRTSMKAQKTKCIILELKNNNIEIESSKLLSQLNKWSQTFARVGNGSWGLKEWLSSDGIKGSVREIVEKLLFESEEPLHISQILNHFKAFRTISEASLFSNIRVSENIHFQFFKCSFVGLKNKNYGEYWFNLPRFTPVIFDSVFRNDSLTNEEKLETLEKKGYPKIHCEFLAGKRNM